MRKDFTTLWLNNSKPIFKKDEIEKPCYKCGYCPYGQLVEEFPLHEDDLGLSCKVFEHNCPVYYYGEFIKED